jgi:hypothetical protein
MPSSEWSDNRPLEGCDETTPLIRILDSSWLLIWAKASFKGEGRAAVPDLPDAEVWIVAGALRTVSSAIDWLPRDRTDRDDAAGRRRLPEDEFEVLRYEEETRKLSLNDPPDTRLRLDWDFAKRDKSSRVAGRMAAGRTSTTSVVASRGLQFRHLPSKTRPGSLMGTIRSSFFWKHLRPHVTHSPRFFLSFSNSFPLITSPVVLKSVIN